MPAPPPDGERTGGCGGVGAAPSDWRSTGPDGCSMDDDGPELTTVGYRGAGALSSVALPATTTIIVGTEVSSTSSAEISSGRRLGENGR